MKVVLTGSTGFIGREVLRQCLESPGITSIIALSRKELPTSVASNPKLKAVVVDDFLSYPDSLLEELRDTDACIWSLGKAFMSDNEVARKINIDYILAAAKAFSQVSSQGEQKKKKKIRFVYVSGAMVERDQSKSLWVAGEYRRIRGQVENELLAHAKEHQDTFGAYIVRPAMVLSEGMNLRRFVFGFGPNVKLGSLTAVMLHLARNGNGPCILDNSDINRLHAELG
ncbi:hypothetical protein AJ80_00653 [Polytolypa hystricis UAMH7299]|uniref:NAD(P)-binding domain-containing protein n=1 Tax=Polytolypa hystricis (strain UAMH7299) TaxID=1447883 RepID=A0A2B7Z2K5_POLH7|nr:hypothetical protein AJ80_00653 [Polytolypa hystricis UAMH7299]